MDDLGYGKGMICLLDGFVVGNKGFGKEILDIFRKVA